MLIVEDDRDLRDMMATLLTMEGFETLTAAHGAAALAMLDRGVDAIILDLMMPVMDGWEFRRRQLAIPMAAAIPVIVVSAIDARRPDGPMIPSVARLSKPVDFDRLIRTLLELCRPTEPTLS